MNDSVRILLVEDLPADVEMNKREISKVVPDCIFRQVDTRKDFLHALDSFKPDVIVSDYSMPQFDGLSALKLSREKSDVTPFILCTGSINEDTAVECMKLGATDYVIKEHNKRLGASVASALELRQNLIQKKMILEKENSHRLNQQTLFDATNKLLFAVSTDEIDEILFNAAVQILPLNILVLSKANHQTGYGQLKRLHGVDPYIPWLKKIFGMDIFSFQSPLGSKASEGLVYNQSKLIHIEGGISALSDYAIPEKICKIVEKALKIKHTYHIGVSDRKIYRGGLTVLAQKELEQDKIELLEIIIKQVSQTLEKLEALEDARQKEDRLQKLLNLAQLKSEAMDQFLQLALNEIIAATHSKIGFICRYHENSKLVDILCWSKSVMSNCKIEDPRKVYHLDDTGIWGEAIRQKKALIINDFQAPHPKKKTYPAGHVNVQKLLVVPFYDKQLINGVVAVGNKESDYQQSDIEQLTLMMESIYRWIKQKEAEQVLFQRKEQLRHVLELSPIGTARCNNHGLLLESNHAFKKIFGLASDSEPSDCNCFNQLFFNQAELETLMNEGLIKTEKTISPKEFEKLFCSNTECFSSSELELIAKAVHIKPESDELEYILQIQDITERKEMDRAKNDFINTVSHEMRTPLTSIQQSLTLLERFLSDNMNFDQQNLLNIANRNCTRLAKLIQNVLDFQKLNSFQMNFNKKHASINDLIKQIMSDLSSFTTNSNLSIETELQTDLPDVLMDKDRISQVLINLISNAVKFTPRGKILIKTAHLPREGQVKISVSDTGIGISAENMVKISQPFFQVRDNPEQKISGTGLGLSICKKILSHHDTDLYIDSKLNEGSTFYFYLKTEFISFPQN
jgi:signal transduction histidine kinase/CheY-like chemotaxis protein